MKVKVSEKDDLLEGGMKKAEANGNVYLLAKVSGELFAMDGLCSHRASELSNGKLTGYVVKCPKHGAEYDVRTGEVVGQVKIPLIGKAKGQKCYPVLKLADGIYLEV